MNRHLRLGLGTFICCHAYFTVHTFTLSVDAWFHGHLRRPIVIVIYSFRANAAMTENSQTQIRLCTALREYNFFFIKENNKN